MLTYLGYDEYCTSQDYSPELDLSKELYFGLIASLVKAADADIIIGDAFDMAYPVSFIQQFPQKIIRVHEADLTQKNLADHTMLYAGPDAVQKAFANGEKHMRSTAYFLTPDAGTPKVICNSPPHYTDFHLSAEKNREIMKTVYNREAYKEALRKIYAGEVLLSGRKHSSKEK
jgi:folate-dependent phosphoribosylglycinamide formyltransferase PurN